MKKKVATRDSPYRSIFVHVTQFYETKQYMAEEYRGVKIMKIIVDARR